MKLKVTRYPNNEVRVAVYPEGRVKDVFASSYSQESGDPEPEKDHFIHLDSDRISSDGIGSNPTLDIKSKVDTPPRKLHMALSRYGRRQVLRAGSCFSKSEDTERLLLTGTLPGSTQQSFRALAQFSTVATKTLCNWLTRHEPGCKWLYCWEFQGRGALHLHLVCEMSKTASEFVKEHFRDEWNRILQKIGNLSSVDMYRKTSTYSHDPSVTQADVTVCDREPSRYVSKYISKSSTNAKGFNRFPPVQWYQVSRALLRELRDKTETFISEGLSYRAALEAIETCTHNLSQHTLAGWRRFEGSVLAWSGYCYTDTFEITDWGKNLMGKGQEKISAEAMYNNGLNTLKNYPAARCFVRMSNVNANTNGNANGTLTETEMTITIEAIASALVTSWSTMRNKTAAAMYIKASWYWLKGTDYHPDYTESFRAEVNKICDEYLTPRPTRTNV